MAIDPTTQVFATQDDTGTVALLFVENDSPQQTWDVGSQGLVSGVPASLKMSGGSDNVSITLPFRVSEFRATDATDETPSLNGLIISAKLDDGSVTPNADWPRMGTVAFNALPSPPLEVLSMFRANAYITVDELSSYLNSRGVDLAALVPQSPSEAALAAYQSAIVKATDYLDQKYRFNGVKLLQTFGNAPFDANAFLVESWLTPYAVQGVSYLTPSTSLQKTQWPRQGVVDTNGDTVNGIPDAIKNACAELASRVLTGVNLQPDYDPNLVGAGGVISSTTKKVGPLEVVTAYDTKLGLGFFASFPQVDRMLSQAGLLSSGGARRVIR